MPLAVRPQGPWCLPPTLRAGLVSVGLVALDGSLISGNASAGATRTYPKIRAEVERMPSEAAEVDEREDAELGERRGDELPEELCDRRSRRQRLRRCKEELEREQAQEQQAYEENLAWRAAWEAENGRKLGGRKPQPPAPDALAKRKLMAWTWRDSLSSGVFGVGSGRWEPENCARVNIRMSPIGWRCPGRIPAMRMSRSPWNFDGDPVDVIRP